MTTDWAKLQSQTIDLLRFPMAVAVVVLHFGTTLTINASGLLKVLCVFFQEGICRLAVPWFFFISGYLFFHHLQRWDWTIWKGKIRRRVRTLIIPYFLWIIITLIARWIYTFFQGESISLLQQFEQCGGIRIFWGTAGKLPISVRDVPLNGPLWFVRDLIYLTIATPVIYFFITRTRKYGILLTALLFLFVQGIIPEGFAFYGIGAYLQLEKKNILELCWPKRKFFYLSSVILLIVFFYFFHVDFWGRFIKSLFLFSGIGSSFCIGAWLLQNQKIQVRPFFAQSSFFIFATHEILILRQIAGPLVQHILPAGPGWMCLNFFLTPTVAVSICLGLLFIMSRLLPRTTAILTGSRYINHAT